MVVDRHRHVFRLALRARIEAADDTLQLGELLHQLGGQIGFGKPRRPHRVQVGMILAEGVTHFGIADIGLGRRFAAIRDVEPEQQHQLFDALGLV